MTKTAREAVEVAEAEIAGAVAEVAVEPEEAANINLEQEAHGGMDPSNNSSNLLLPLINDCERTRANISS